MTRTAAVTVAIPTYQRDHFLKDALDSVVRQTLTDLEIIVSDNANSRATRKLVESYGDPRIAYAPLRENIGIHGNLTRCLHLGSAPYVSVLLDDDTMYPTNLEKKLSLLQQYPTVGVAHSALDYIDDAGMLVAQHIRWSGPATHFETGREFIELAMGLGNRICVSSALVQRSAVAQRCHDERDGAFSDLGLWLRIATSWDFAFVDEALTTFRVHPGAASSALGLYDIATDGLIATPEMVKGARTAKLRFLNEYGAPVRVRRALTWATKDRARTELKHMVAEKTLAARSPALTARSLREAARVEPSLWWSPWSALLLASSVVGRKAFDSAVAWRVGH